MHSLIRCMCIDKPVVLSDQLVGANVRIGNGGFLPGDEGLLPFCFAALFQMLTVKADNPRSLQQSL